MFKKERRKLPDLEQGRGLWVIDATSDLNRYVESQALQVERPVLSFCCEGAPTHSVNPLRGDMHEVAALVKRVFNTILNEESLVLSQFWVDTLESYVILLKAREVLGLSGAPTLVNLREFLAKEHDEEKLLSEVEEAIAVAKDPEVFKRALVSIEVRRRFQNIDERMEYFKPVVSLLDELIAHPVLRHQLIPSADHCVEVDLVEAVSTQQVGIIQMNPDQGAVYRLAHELLLGSLQFALTTRDASGKGGVPKIPYTRLVFERLDYSINDDMFNLLMLSHLYKPTYLIAVSDWDGWCRMYQEQGRAARSMVKLLDSLLSSRVLYPNSSEMDQKQLIDLSTEVAAYLRLSNKRLKEERVLFKRVEYPYKPKDFSLKSFSSLSSTEVACWINRRGMALEIRYLQLKED